MRSKVKWFDEKKGYGFIENISGNEDIFVHFQAIDLKGYRNLIKDQVVDFDVEETTKGPIARNVKPVEETQTIE